MARRRGALRDDPTWTVLAGDGCNTIYGCGWGADQKAQCSAAAVNAKDGDLAIGVVEKSRKKELVAGRVTSLGKVDFTFGKVEVRAKFPAAKGLVGAISLLPSRSDAPTSSGDRAQLDLIVATEGGGKAGLHVSRATVNCPPLSVNTADAYHTYGLEWDRGAVRWYVDHVQQCTQTRWPVPQGREYPAPLDGTFHIVMSISPSAAAAADGGSVAVAVAEQGGATAAAAPSVPAEMRVDFVRVYLLYGEGQWKPMSAALGGAGNEAREPHGALLHTAAIIGLCLGPFLALVGSAAPRVNTFLLTVVVSGFKAVVIARLLGATPAVAALLACAVAAFAAFVAARTQAFFRAKMVAALALSTLLFLVDMGLIAALGSKTAALGLLLVLLVAYAGLVHSLPPTPKADIPFVLATAAVGSCMFKESVECLAGQRSSLTFLEDPLADACSASAQCRDLVVFWAFMFVAGAFAQTALLRRLRRRHTALSKLSPQPHRASCGGDGADGWSDVATVSGTPSPKRAAAAAAAKRGWQWGASSARGLFDTPTSPLFGTTSLLPDVPEGGAKYLWSERRGSANVSVRETGDTLEMVVDSPKRSTVGIDGSRRGGARTDAAASSSSASQLEAASAQREQAPSGTRVMGLELSPTSRHAANALPPQSPRKHSGEPLREVKL
ncbi:concanavalin A-like lectin/glucanase domain-containing protein [Tribonema minus]|uniref:Concanavalin A-like lectin/glucanase domain-containing protein n=1 Tax=Tribonema minus TaxID=303371 RepID=A0A835Z8C5_9STRA|nr:concanavalin A-like lectin/glucanase domain-containing protein [Tribonema minus]